MTSPNDAHGEVLFKNLFAHPDALPASAHDRTCLVYDRLALLVHVLLDVVEAARSLAG